LIVLPVLYAMVREYELRKRGRLQLQEMANE
jgi:hypothetical protein